MRADDLSMTVEVARYVRLVLTYEYHREYYYLPPDTAAFVLMQCPYLDPRPLSARIEWGSIIDRWSY